MSATYCKHNLKWVFPWNGKISLKERKKKKKWEKIAEFIPYSWTPLLSWYFVRNIAICRCLIKNWKTKLLIQKSLLYTALILAGNQTQVVFSSIIPLDFQDLPTVNTVWMNRYQTTDIIYVKSFHWIIEYYF